MLTRVAAAGVDRGTWHVMTGLPLLARLGLGLRRPKDRIPGRDVAGTIIALGDGVTEHAIGDAVYGTARGSFAELAVLPLTRLAPCPSSITVEEDGGGPLSGLTPLPGPAQGGVGRRGPPRPPGAAQGRRRPR